MTNKQSIEHRHDENFWAILALARFFLAITVLIHHTHRFDNFLFSIIRVFSGNAAIGAFFLISGYSIASSVSHKPKHFYQRRLWRIYPAYLVALCVSFLPLVIYGQDSTFNWTGPTNLVQVIGAFFFMQGIFVMRPSCNSVIWSLAPGEICYCLAPFFQKAKPWLIIGLIAASSILYASKLKLDYVHPLYSQQIWGFSTAVFLWTWLLGFAYYKWRGHWCWPLVLLPTILFYFNDEYAGVLAPLTAGITGFLLIKAVKFKVLPASLRKLFLYLGDLSYPLYLVQKPAMNWVVKLCGDDTAWLQYFAVFVFSDLLLRFIVRPFRRIGDRSHIDQVIDRTKIEARQERAL